MKIKASELIGPALDWAVAKCLWPDHIHKYPAWWFDQHPDGCYLYEAIDGGDSSVAAFSPQTLWSQGGPIIYREKISVRCIEDALRGDRCIATKWVGGSVYEYSDPAYLIAAMRCYVASKLGDEVEIPDELMVV